MELRASRTASPTCLVTASCTAFSAACCSFPSIAAIIPSGVITTRCGLGASAGVCVCCLEAAADGDGNVATSAILCSGLSGGSSSFTATGAGSSAGATAGANCAIAVFVALGFIQSWGGATMPQTFPGFSNSTPTCCSSRELWEVWTERTLARTAGGLGSTFNPTTCNVTHDPTP